MTFPPRMGYHPPEHKPIKQILFREVADAVAGRNSVAIDVRGRTVYAIFGRDIDNAVEISFDIAPPVSKTDFEETNFPLLLKGMTAADVGVSLILERPMTFPLHGDWRIVVNFLDATLNDRIRVEVLVG